MGEFARPQMQRELRISCKIMVGNLRGRDNFRDRRMWMGSADRMHLKEIICEAPDCFDGLRV
jgi:hypothetical protein